MLNKSWLLFLEAQNNISWVFIVLSHFCRVWLFPTLRTVTPQAPLSVGFPRQDYWSGLPFSPPGDLSDPGIEPVSLLSPVLAGGFLPLVPPGKPPGYSKSFNFVLVLRRQSIWFLRAATQGTCRAVSHSRIAKRWKTSSSEISEPLYSQFTEIFIPTLAAWFHDSIHSHLLSHTTYRNGQLYLILLMIT